MKKLILAGTLTAVAAFFFTTVRTVIRTAKSAGYLMKHIRS